MSDKPLVQQALASELAELVLIITTTPSSLAFLGGFWETIVREWNGIDRLRYAYLSSHRDPIFSSPIARHRMDKYYMLVRRFVNASFRLLLREDWDPEICKKYNEILTRQGGPLWCVKVDGSDRNFTHPVFTAARMIPKFRQVLHTI